MAIKRIIILVILFLFMGASSFSQDSDYKDNEMKVMSYNIRYDNAGDGINQWNNRKERVASLLDFYQSPQ